MGALLPLLLQGISAAVAHGQQIKEAIDVGESVVETLKKHAPELHDLVAFVASQIPDHPGDDNLNAKMETVGRTIFAPHMTSQQEKAWMDRASMSFG